MYSLFSEQKPEEEKRGTRNEKKNAKRKIIRFPTVIKIKTLIVLAPAVPVSPLVFLATCANIQGIRAVSAPAAPTKLPACAE